MTTADAISRTPTIDLADYPEPPVAGDEVAALLASLDRLRFYIAWKCGGLTAEQLDQRLPPSAITLAGMLQHLARTENSWFSWVLWGERPRSPWDQPDAPDEWSDPYLGGERDPEALMALWQQSCAESRERTARALAAGGLDHPGAMDWGDSHPNLRRIVHDMIEEYGRHVGHVDLIRESIDGLVGEDPA